MNYKRGLLLILERVDPKWSEFVNSCFAVRLSLYTSGMGFLIGYDRGSTFLAFVFFVF